MAKGFLISLPSLAIESPVPDLIWRPELRRSVVFFDSRVPSKVSTRASSTRNVLDRTVNRVDDSERVRSAAETAASGP